MPRASPPTKRQPGVTIQRESRQENTLGNHGKRAVRLQPKTAATSMTALSRGDGVGCKSSATIASSASTASASSFASQPPALSSPLLAVATATAATATTASSCRQESDAMATAQPESLVQSTHSARPSYLIRHRNSDSNVHHLNTGPQVAPEISYPSSSTDSLHTLPPLSNGAASTVNTSMSSVAPSPTIPLAVPHMTFDDTHRRIDVNTAKNSNVHRDTGPFDLAFTILRSCPLYDTVAILVILMQLSPVALSTVYMMFTVLTFVPPVTNGSGLTLTEFFEGALGTPALATVACMDVGVLLLWLFLWSPLQLLILDFAQIVIALTLGGGCSSGSATYHQGSTNNIFACLAIILFSHFSQFLAFQNIPHLGPLFIAGQPSISADHPLAYQPASRMFARRVGGASWVRNIFAVHILTQGIVRYVREWYLRRERRHAKAHAIADPEAGSGSYIIETPMEPAFGNHTDSDTDHYATNTTGVGSYTHSSGTNANISGVGSSTGVPIVTPSTVVGNTVGSTAATTSLSAAATDGDSAGAGTPSNVTNNGGSVGSPAGHVSAKKKRKQSALVRLRQPLWAALASTKIVMMKEYELSQTASESAGAEATDVDNLGNAPFYSQPRQIWICYVGYDEVCFGTSVFPYEVPSPKQDIQVRSRSSSYIDTTKPFYVRINHATWQATRITPAADVDDDNTVNDSPTKMSIAGTRWTGDIYGLTPLSSYECEFVSTYTDEIIFSTSVRTAAIPSRTTDVADAKPAPHSQLRPHESPATTIKASIATQEAKLNDERARFKMLRKDNNRHINILKKEIERLTVSVQSAGGNDEKLRQKITQNTVQQKQAEHAIEDVEASLRELCILPENLVSQHRSKKSEWDREKAQFDGAVAAFKSFKSSLDSELRLLEDEKTSLQSKRNKITTRIAKADNDLLRIVDANARGLDEAERRRQEHAAVEAEMALTEKMYCDRLAKIKAGNERKVSEINVMHETLRSFYASFNSERPYEETRFSSGSPLPTSVPLPASVAMAAPGAWPPHLAPVAVTGYSTPQFWNGVPVMGASIHASGLPSVGPALQYMQTQLHSSAVPQPAKMRGRSSSMLSDVSGFTQSSTADDDTNAQAIGAASPASMPSYLVSQTAALRGPPGYSFTRARGSSGSASSASVRSGSASAGSVRDPASPL